MTPSPHLWPTEMCLEGVGSGPLADSCLPHPQSPRGPQKLIRIISTDRAKRRLPGLSSEGDQWDSSRVEGEEGDLISIPFWSHWPDPHPALGPSQIVSVCPLAQSIGPMGTESAQTRGVQGESLAQAWESQGIGEGSG